MSDTHHAPAPEPRLMGAPRTNLGWWSVGLSLAFFVLFTAWLLYVRATPIHRPTFFSDPIHAILILGAAASAVVGAVAGAVSVVAGRERSVLVLFGVVLGAFVLYRTVAEIWGH